MDGQRIGNMAERKLNGIWNAERLLQNLLRFADDCGNIRSQNLSDNSPYGIKMRRFAAVMKAYGKEDCLYHGIGYVISKTCSGDKINELCQLLSQNLRDKYSTAFVKPEDFKGVQERKDLFEALFRYRKSLYRVENIWSGMMECTQTVALAYMVTTNLNQTQLKAISDIIDRMLVLLIGDDYDRSFSEEKLLPLGYPDVTDEELEDMILDNW